MSFLIFWLLSAIVSGALMSFGCWWCMSDARKDPYSAEDSRIITLKDVLVCAGLMLVPVLNTLVIAAMLIWIFIEVAPKIVLFGPVK